MYRHEYKYFINAGQEMILRIRAAGLLQPDPHTKSDGTYLIRSLYMDDINDTCLDENMSGTDPRSKFRIRYYNGNPSLMFLEKKSKVRGMCNKVFCKLTLSDYDDLINGRIPQFSEDTPEMKKQLLTEACIRGMMPKVIVTYERVPFIYNGGNVRITLDRKITSSSSLDRFLSADYPERPILPCGQSLLEVKWDELLPRHIKDYLLVDGLTWTAFSKYAMCRLFPSG